MQIGIVVVAVVGVVGVVIGNTVYSRDFQYGMGVKKGRNDYKKGRRTKYQTFYLERKKKSILSAYKTGYMDAYSCEMHKVI